MSNIEIHGYDNLYPGEAHLAGMVRSKIMELLKNKKQFPDVATEIVWSSCRDGEGKTLPYLRVWDTDENRAMRITSILRLNGFHVERPVKLVCYVEPAMWSETEIVADLEEIHRVDFAARRISESFIVGAIEAAQERNYETVAHFYVHIASSLRVKLQPWLPSREQLAIKVDPEMAAVGICADESDQNRLKTRFVMVLQFIDSLVPQWGKTRYYIASE